MWYDNGVGTCFLWSSAGGPWNWVSKELARSLVLQPVSRVSQSWRTEQSGRLVYYLSYQQEEEVVRLRKGRSSGQNTPYGWGWFSQPAWAGWLL
jgi:hypothetical protein